VEVRDPVGAGVSASGEILSQGNEFRRSFQIGNDGNYVLQDLPYGVYRLSVQAQGFAVWSDVVEVHSVVPIRVGVPLSVASITTKVQVTEEKTLVDPTATGSLFMIGRQSIATEQRTIMSGYKQTEVGVIPEDWEVKSVGSLLKRGRLGGNYQNLDVETPYPLIKMGNIDRGFIDTSEIQYISPGVTPDASDRLRCGDLLFNTRNTLDLVGKVAIWKDELPVAYYNSNLMRLEFDPDQICSN
jgi:hypothetical protein